MNRIVASAVLLSSLVLSAVAFQPQTADAQAGPNLLANPSFEEGGLFTPTDWDTTVAGVPTVLFYWDPDVTHGGKKALSIVNAGDMIPIWHNWNQMIPNAQKYADKDLELSVWTRSAQLSGRGYCMVQCYRDTVMNHAIAHNMTREQARKEMGYKYADDPQLEMGWARQVLLGRELGLDAAQGEGLRAADDRPHRRALRPVRPGPGVVRRRLADRHAREAGGRDRARPQSAGEPGLRARARRVGVLDPSDAGRHHRDGLDGRAQRPLLRDDDDAAEARLPDLPGRGAGVQRAQPLGKRVRMSGWCKLENINDTSAYLSIYATGLYGVDGSLAGDALSGTKDWTYYTVEWDVPKDSYTVWARAGYQTTLGKCWWDDLKFEVLGDTQTAGKTAKKTR
jgi:hypothetical protein